MPITDYSIEQLLHLYRQMLLVREFELRPFRSGEPGSSRLHPSCVGQEATAAPVRGVRAA